MPRHTLPASLLLVGTILGALTMTEHAPSSVAHASAESPAADPADAAFALDLFGKLRSGSGNVAFSPFSITTALGMTMAGAKGTTADEMGKVLHRPASDPKTQGILGELVSAMNEEGKKGHVQLLAANALFGQTGEPFTPGYLDFVTEKYGAELRSLDFSKAPEPSRETINKWVESKTNEKIKNLLESGTITAETSLVLVNAVYFKGDWQNEFNKSATQDAPFSLMDGKTINVPTMHQTSTFSYGEAAGAQLLRLPYKGNRQSMYVILPKLGEELAGFEAKMKPENVEEWLAKLSPQRVALSLPKFTTTSQFNLSETLRSLGMRTAFTGAADFTGIRPSGGFQISEVVHQAFVAVDEKGTEAAAATAVIGVRSAAIVRPPVIFKADHPFYFLIRDDRTGAWLFFGRIVEPKA